MRDTKWMAVLFCSLCAGIAACNGVSSNPSTATGGTGTAGSAPVEATTPKVSVAQSVSTPVSSQPTAVTAVPNVAPVIASTPLGSPGAANLPALTVHLAGDSTVSNYAATTVQEGWGMELGQFFIDKVTIDNKAIGGANVKTFRSGNWPKIMAVVKPGDYVMMQFGANDSGTAHGPVSPPDFATNFGEMADEVKGKGGTMIFVTPSAFYDWTAGKQNNARLAPYAAACYTAGDAKGVLVDDLNARGVEWLNSIGQTAAADFYLPNSQHVPDKAHFVKAGATKMAQMVAEELKRIKSPLAAYLK